MLFFSEFLRRRHGRPLHRVPIDLGLGCPRRDPRTGADGCRFCAGDGTGIQPRRTRPALEVQVAAGIHRARKQHGPNVGLIAYFQAGTSTNAPPETVRKLFTTVLQAADFDMVVTATRPDCLPEDTVAFLSELSESRDVWVELGVQTANDATLTAMNRGHDFASVENAAQRLDSAGVHAAAHIILGLPGEGPEDYRHTAERLTALPFSAVKIHNLLVMKNTPLAARYRRGEFKVMDEYEYAQVLIDFMTRLPAHWPLMRIAADAKPDAVVAPTWSMKKGQFIEFVKNAMAEARRGREFRGPMVTTDDGSRTAFHPVYREHFHCLAGARSEAWKKYIEPCPFPPSGNFRLLDVGFGLGYNAIETIRFAARNGLAADVVSLEREAGALTLALDARNPDDELDNAVLHALRDGRKWSDGRSSLTLLLDDARTAARRLADKSNRFDVVFLDAFSPDKNPELWTYDFIRLLRRLLRPGGTIATYSSAYSVRGALVRAGLAVGDTPPFGRKRPGTIASADPANVTAPIVGKELAIVKQSTAGLPFRDPPLNWTPRQIREFRGKVTRRLRARGVPKWIEG